VFAPVTVSDPRPALSRPARVYPCQSQTQKHKLKRDVTDRSRPPSVVTDLLLKTLNWQDVDIPKHHFPMATTMISDNLFSELVKKRGEMNWGLVAPLFWAPMLPLTRLAASKAPAPLRMKMYLGVASLGTCSLDYGALLPRYLSFLCCLQFFPMVYT
jgi:hypothetical protein